MVKMRMLKGHKCVWIDIPEDLVISVDKAALPKTWRAIPAPKSTKKIGDQWFNSLGSPALKVPSTVISVEHNFVINPSHPRFPELTIGEIENFIFDERLFS